MFDKILADINNSLDAITREFFDEQPTSYIDADFEVETMKIFIALDRNQITDKDASLLLDMLLQVERLWRKLFDK